MDADGAWLDPGRTVERILRAAPTALLRDVTDGLIEMHGQSDSTRLTTPSAQRELLDRFGGDAIAVGIGVDEAIVGVHGLGVLAIEVVALPDVELRIVCQLVQATLVGILANRLLGPLGVAMAVHPAWAVYRLAHMHMLLLGFVTMMIYGVAYHVVPRFVGFRLHRPDAAQWHWWSANVGLALMVVAFVGLYAAVGAEAIDRSRIRGDGLASLLYVTNWHEIASGTVFLPRA